MIDFDKTVLEIFAEEGVDCRSRLFKGTVSNTQAIRIAHTIRKQVLNATEFKTFSPNHGTFILSTTHCSVCSEPQFNTSSGMTCKNGHGGAIAKEFSYFK